VLELSLPWFDFDIDKDGWLLLGKIDFASKSWFG